jgi:diguanylate cyclase (GGDEF)-like protein
MLSDRSNHWLKLVDEESGLYNRLYLIHHLTESFARARRYNAPLSCLVIQAKPLHVNEEDSKSEALSPSAVRALGGFLSSNIRTGDILGRWAADELLLVASNTAPEGLHTLTEIISDKARTAPSDEPTDLAVSVHTGVAGLPDDEKIIRHAEAMPLLARERLTPVFHTGKCKKSEPSY